MYADVIPAIAMIVVVQAVLKVDLLMAGDALPQRLHLEVRDVGVDQAVEVHGVALGEPGDGSDLEREDPRISARFAPEESPEFAPRLE